MRQRIKPYTGIVELASPPGHNSSDSVQKKDQLQLSSQEAVEKQVHESRVQDPRRLRITSYTGIVELASSPGHMSSDNSVHMYRVKHHTQDGGEITGTNSMKKTRHEI